MSGNSSEQNMPHTLQPLDYLPRKRAYFLRHNACTDKWEHYSDGRFRVHVAIALAHEYAFLLESRFRVQWR